MSIMHLHHMHLRLTIMPANCAAPSSQQLSARQSSGTTFSCTARWPDWCSASCSSPTTPLTATLNSFAIYFVGFVARPIGAFIFGHYGDRVGRKSTLIVTLILMGMSTFLVAFLPGYATIGIWGAVLLTVLRLIQGIGVGGEWGGSVLLSMEWARITGSAASLPRGRSSADRPVCSSPIWRCWCSAGCRAKRFCPGAGAFHLRSASCWSPSACGSGCAFWKRRCSATWWPSARSNGLRSSKSQEGAGRDHRRHVCAHLRAGAVLHLHRVHLRLRDDDAACVARSAVGRRAGGGVRVGFHHPVQRLAVGSDRAQEDVHHRLRHDGHLRLRLFRA